MINQLLRQELNFDGFVISECLEMEALYHSVGWARGDFGNQCRLRFGDGVS